MHDRQRGKGLNAAIFDWGGTVVDYGCRAPAAALVEAFNLRGVTVTIEQAREAMGVNKRVHLEMISKLPAVADQWMRVHGRACDNRELDALFEQFLSRLDGYICTYADLIPGTQQTIGACRDQGMKIGSSSGYSRSTMDVLQEKARKNGFEPDAVVCGDEVPAGRPEPWMCLANAQALRVFPLDAIVKVGDTVSDIAAGRNAGMWTIGVAKTSSVMGLGEDEIAALPQPEYRQRLDRVYQTLNEAGADYVVDTIADIAPCLDQINHRLASGEKP